MKTCCRCSLTKPVSDFSRCRAKKSGLNSFCKTCDQLRYRANLERNRERNRKRQRARRATPEGREVDRARALASREKVRAYHREYWKRNRGRCLQWHREWRRANLEIQLVGNLQRSDLHPLEEAQGYQQLMKRGYKIERLAERVGRSINYVYDRIKLLELSPKAKKLFLDQVLTAGHAILLARLATKDQDRALSDSECLHCESLLWDPHDQGGGRETLKPCSVREMQAWIDKHVRFEAKKADPMLFPEATSTVAEASARSAKVVPITYEYALSPDKKGDERTLCVKGWKRADGREGSKACEHAVLGVVAIGYGRGEAFDVCAAKEKCQVHWKKEQKAKAKRARRGGRASEDIRVRQGAKVEAEEAKRRAIADQWRKATPAILEAVAAAVSKAPTKAGRYLADIVVKSCSGWRSTKGAGELVPRGKTAEDLVRHAAFLVLFQQAEDKWNAPAHFPEVCKALNVDVKAILDQVAPEEKPEKARPTKKRKGLSRKKAAKK